MKDCPKPTWWFKIRVKVGFACYLPCWMIFTKVGDKPAKRTWLGRRTSGPIKVGPEKCFVFFVLLWQNQEGVNR